MTAMATCQVVSAVTTALAPPSCSSAPPGCRLTPKPFAAPALRPGAGGPSVWKTAPVTPEELQDALEREADTLITVARDHMADDVPSCPGWTVETLVNHLGRVHRWARELVAAGGDGPPPFPGRPDEVTEEWFRAGVREFTAAFAEAGADGPAWTFLGPGTARFWMRRQALETAVHRWDVELAAGSPTAVDAELAVVGVDEVLDMHVPRLLAGDDPPSLPHQSLHLHASDNPHGEWIVGSDGGEMLVGHGHEKGDAAVRGSASDLLLWMWGRRTLDDLEVMGDRAVAEAWAGVIAD